MERAAVFIDAGYLNKMLSEASLQHQIDLARLSEILCEHSSGSRRFRTYYYDCMPYQSNPPTDEEKARYSRKDRFFASLRKETAFEVRLGRLAKSPDGKFSQKMVDILLSIDLTMLSAKGAIQRAILVSGDSDFVPAVKLAKDQGVYVHLFHGKRNHAPLHDQLLDSCDERTEITEELLLKAKK